PRASVRSLPRPSTSARAPPRASPSAIPPPIPAEAPVTSARLPTNCKFTEPLRHAKSFVYALPQRPQKARHRFAAHTIDVFRLCKNLIVSWSAVGCGVVTRNARMAFDQNGITKLVRAVAVLAEHLENLV